MRTTHPLMLPRQHLSLSRTYPGKRPAAVYLPAPRGFSLVELMIAMLIGLILTAGMIQLFTGSSQTYRYIESLSRVQENGRFALNILQYDLRQAGFVGCLRPVQASINNIVDPPSDGAFNPDSIIEGFDNVASGITIGGRAVVAGTDYIIIHGGGQIGRLIEEKVANANAKIEENVGGWQAGDIMIISDCSTMDIFRATNVSQGSGHITIAHANNGNTNNRLSKVYEEGADVMAYQRKTFFISINENTNLPSLWSFTNRNPSATSGFEVREHIEGVRDMQITYLQGNTYVAANAVTNWGNVSAVRVSLLLQSERANLADAPMTLPYNDAAFTAPDRRFYQVFTTTVGLRNRLP